MNLSAALIIKNEAASLDACLESITPIADEIVVVDTGSQDDSVSVARRYTGRLFHFSWIDDFAAARNYCIEQATGDYILSIDADTTVENPEQARALLDRFIHEHDDGVVGTATVISPQGTEPDAPIVTADLPRFFARDAYRYRGAIHEQLVSVSGSSHCAAPTGLRYLHAGYAQDACTSQRKTLRNIRLLEKALRETPNDDYCFYQLGKAYFSMKKFPEAANAFEAALEHVRFAPAQPPVGYSGLLDGDVLTDLVVSLAYAYVNQDEPQRALALLQTHQGYAHAGTIRADFPHALGYTYLMLGEIELAKKAYTDSLSLGTSREQVRGTGSYSSYYHLGLLCEAEKDLPGALREYANALQLKGDYAMVLTRLVDFIIEYQTAPPAQFWDVVDKPSLIGIYVAKLHALLAQGKGNQAALLLKASSLLSPELTEACTAALAHADVQGDNA